MGLDNPIHIAFLLILLLLVFGAKRLPEMGRSLGSGMRGFKDAISGEDHPVTHPAAHHAPVADQPTTLAAAAEPHTAVPAQAGVAQPATGKLPA